MDNGTVVSKKECKVKPFRYGQKKLQGYLEIFSDLWGGLPNSEKPLLNPRNIPSITLKLRKNKLNV